MGKLINMMVERRFLIRWCYLFLLIYSCFNLLACANKPLVAKTNPQLETLFLCMNFSEQADSSEKLLYLDAINQFIETYNNSQKELVLQPCNKSQQQSLIITVNKTKWVEPNKQAFYVVVSTIGIAYPLSGGSFGFAWFAMNESNLQLAYSPDLAGTGKPVYRYVRSWPYFNGIEALKIKHMAKFQEFLFETLSDIEKDLTIVRS